MGLDGPWDIRQVVGTVPVEEDGSALFRVPANTPLGVQPLDHDGKALQLMRSWMTAMPGEVLSCVGCHERQNSVIPNRQTIASRNAPAEIAPLYGPVRGFSFRREVQPVLDANCTRCHDGAAGRPDLRRDGEEANVTVPSPHYTRDMAFSPSYTALRKYVRGHTMESDIHLLTPMEFHADTSRLMRMIEKGHHGVTLDDEAWDRLITWIDMNAPYHGTWAEIPGEKNADMADQRARREAMLKQYAQRVDESERIFNPYSPPAEAAAPSPMPEAPRSDDVTLAGWPLDRASAEAMQDGVRSIDLGGGVALELVRIPAGRFVMGGFGHADEQPREIVDIGEPFSMGALRSDERAIRALRSGSRQPHRIGRLLTVHRRGAGLAGERSEATCLPRIVDRGGGVLRLADGADRAGLLLAYGDAVGVRVPRRLGHAHVVRRDDGRFHAVGEFGRCVAGARRQCQSDVQHTEECCA